MNRIRVIPVLLLDNGQLVKTVKYAKPNYIGDPINAVKIFNEKEVDEIVLLDISVTSNKKEPDFKKIEEIASEAFMPFAYGGGIRNLDQIKRLFNIGIEKIVLNSILQNNLNLITEASAIYGSQSIIVSVDIKPNLFGKIGVYTHSGTKKINTSLGDYLIKLEEKGAGEIMLNFISRDGTYKGYDLEQINYITKLVKIPVIACGGASGLNDFLDAINHGASAVAAGSFFVYKGTNKGILINYPEQEQLLTLYRSIKRNN